MDLNKCKKSNKKYNKKGIYYMLDALLASILLVGAVILLLNYSNHSSHNDNSIFLSQDLLNALSTLKISEVNDEQIENWINDGVIENSNITVLEQIGFFWALNNVTEAELLSSIVLSSLNVSRKEISLRVGGEYIYSYGLSNNESISISRRMVAGIAKGKPITGTSASAYLKKIKDKKTSSYSYFGGFIGQGIISKHLRLPSDFMPSRLIDAELKIETPGNFQVFVNDIACGNLRNGVDGSVLIYDLSFCNASFHAGDNIIKLDFSSSIIDDSYVAGGYIKATYTTDVLQEQFDKNKIIYNFPGIEGLINIYDSITAQGNITKVVAYLDFYNEYDTFMTIGNHSLMYESGSNESRFIIEQLEFTGDDFSNQLPIRMGVTNLTNITTILDGIPADVFLITDVSGSMSTCGVYSSPLTCRYNCWIGGSKSCPVADASDCSSSVCGGTCWVPNNYRLDCDATFMDVAKDADKVFVDEVLNNSALHKIGLVKFSTSATLDSSLTNHANTLKSIIDTYSAGGGTCTCCGINRARNAIMSSDKERFMVILSDGVPTFYCDDFNDYAGSGTMGDSSGNVMNTADENWAIDAAQLACDNNITVYSIGFGDAITSDGHDVLSQLACNESLYFNTANMDELAEIFKNISSQILLVANYSSQTIQVEGEFIYSNLSSNSYLEVFYDPFVESQDVGKIQLSFESAPFDCDANIYIPENIEIIDAKIASFSGNAWTRKLNIANDDVNELIYDIDYFNTDYPLLGDPFQIQVPHVLLKSGQYNNFSILVGDSPSNSSACSSSNTLIYSGFLNSSTLRTDALEFSDGCVWFVESVGGTILEINIPEDYSGTNTCYYNSSSTPSFNEFDAYDVAMNNLLRQLDPNLNGSIIVNLDESDLEIKLTIIGSIPYMWGPSIVEVEVGS